MGKIQIFADGADLEGIRYWAGNPIIRGFTTNPSLMRQANVTNYEDFARQLLLLVPDRPVSFEVLVDDFENMERQARRIASWGPHVYVKIPITNSQGLSSAELIRKLSRGCGIKVNVTAITTKNQVERAALALCGGAPSFLSIFAGRIADTGIDPVPTIEWAVEHTRSLAALHVIWASSRELLNIREAEDAGCDIITLPCALLQKLAWLGRGLERVSLDTVKQFAEDAKQSGLSF